MIRSHLITVVVATCLLAGLAGCASRPYYSDLPEPSARAPVTRASAAPSGVNSYVVKAGDTLHSIAFAPREALAGDFLNAITREAFGIAHDISSYSLAALAKGARPLMQGRPGSIVTLTYLGAVRSVPNYNVMGLAKASLEANVRYLASCLGSEGIRANGISAGPIKTLAAAGIGNFSKLLSRFEARAPIHRGITIDEVGNVAAFLFSDLASAITGEIVYGDGGYSTVAVGAGEES